MVGEVVRCSIAYIVIKVYHQKLKGMHFLIPNVIVVILFD